jgi:hypothetical protein
LLAILNIAFFPALWGNRTLMTSAGEAPSLYTAGAKPTPAPGVVIRTPDPGSSAWQLEPGMAFNGTELFHHFRFPRWNPYVGYGAPWAAGMLSQPAFPLALLPEALPTPRAISWFIVLRVFTAGIFAFLFMRYFLSFPGSIVAAISCMLTGYFVLFLNIDHLSTEVLLPAVFWSFERMYRIASSRGVVPAAVIVCLTVVSGMPESTLLLLSFGYAYYLLRTLSDRSVPIVNSLGRLAAANVLGFGLAAFLLLPFWEFLQNGLDDHRHQNTPVGLISVTDPRGLLLFLLPLIFGHHGIPTLGTFAGGSGLFGYFGIGPVVLATIAVLSLFRGRRDWRSTEHKVIVFFLCAVVFCLMKHWGSPMVNWIGRLPLFNLVQYPKYIQPLAGFALACLAGFGAAAVSSGKYVAESWASVGAVLISIVLLFLSYRVTLYHGDVALVHPIYLVLLAGLIVLFAWTGVLGNSHGVVFRRYLPPLIILLIASELSANYVFPVYYIVGHLSTEDRNPYAGASYIDFLKSKRADYYRVFGRGVLFPNWAAVFGLHDVRYLFAVTYDRYLKFAQAFLGAGIPHDELQNRFAGYPGSYTMLSPMEQRFLQLSSIRYLASATPYVERESTLTTQVLEQNMARVGREPLSRSAFTLDGRSRDVLFQHPPSSRLSLTTVVPADAPQLRVSPAIDPKLTPGCGDGVTFQLELDDPSKGNPKMLYDRYINPKASPAAQHWNDEFIDLKPYAGRNVHLLFSTNGGPAGNTACDWAGWGDLRFLAAPSRDIDPRDTMFRMAFTGTADVYEYPFSLPRTAVFSSAVMVNSPEAALDAIRRPEFDPWRQVVVEASSSDIGTLRQQRPQLASAAHIESYDSDRVVIRAQTGQPGLLLLTDSNYPGWNATVDGLPATILKTNYLFRGVILTPGSHRVEFRYSPGSYAAGYGISLLSALAGVAWLVLDRRRERRRSEPVSAASVC